MDALAEVAGVSPGIASVRERVRRVLAAQAGARRLPPLLFQGETGTGKGLLARTAHETGPRADRPFVSINCAAIPDALLEAELFGFERGAFTGANAAKPGLFQSAHGGTVFLDEIGLMAEPLQAKLLTVLDDRAVRRLGSTRVEPVDVWVMAATSLDLEAAVRSGRFREDLYHRLAVLPIRLPPLRERGDDVLLLAEQFLTRACRDYGLSPKRLTAEARAALLGYRWPGNVRELANALERAALLTDGDEVSAATLGLPETGEGGNGEPDRTALLEGDTGPAPSSYRANLDRLEREQLLEALERAGWNISRAAAWLGVPRNTLRYRVARHRLGPGAGPRRGRQRGEAAPAAVDGADRRVAEGGTPPPILRQRLVSVLRVDVPGPAPWRRHQGLALVTGKVEAFGGRILHRHDGGLDAVFGLEPTEDAPERAANVALAIRRLVNRAQQEQIEVQLRAALETMHAFVEERVRGETEMTATSVRDAEAALSALMEQAEAHDIVVGPGIWAHLQRRFALAAPRRASGPTRLMGRDAGDGERTLPLVPGRGPFVGRVAELGVLEQRLRQVAETGRGHIIRVVGDTGIGKSRLLDEFRSRLEGQGVAFVEGRCASHQASVPSALLIDLLRRACEVDDLDPADRLAAAASEHLTTIGLSQTGPDVLALLGMPVTARAPSSAPTGKIRSFDAVRSVLLARARGGPLALLLEDLHWADPTSEEFVGFLANSLAGVPMLVVATTRPGYRAPWLDRSWASQLALPPLGGEASMQVVRALRPDLSATSAEALARRAEGNPFFLEELALADAGSAVHRARTHALKPTGGRDPVSAARIERLVAEACRDLEAAGLLKPLGPPLPPNTPPDGGSETDTRT